MRNRKDDIERYLRGELSAAEMHALEKEALDDPFLAEALEGLEHAGAEDFLHDLHSLNRKVHDRTRQRKRSATKMFGWTAGMAATVLLVAVSGFLVISLVRQQNARQQALREEELLLIETSTDTLIVMFPYEGLRRAKQLAYNDDPSAKETKKSRSSAQTDVGESRAERRTLPAERDESPRTSEAEDTGTEITTEAERDRIAIAEIPTEETPAVQEEDVQPSSKKLDSRTAGVQSRQSAPPVAQSLSDNVKLLQGKVTSASDGEGLPGVNVTLTGTNVSTVTDAEGNYQLPVPTAESKVIFTFIGFEPREVTVENKEELNVTLNEDLATLSEVVVVSGYGTANTARDNPATFSPAAPGGGKNDFKDHLNRTINYPQEALARKVEGRVTVRFTVQPDARLTDFEIVRGIGYGCEEELIRAIKAGPAWKPASRGGVPLADKVKVRYRFELP